VNGKDPTHPGSGRPTPVNRLCSWAGGVNVSGSGVVGLNLSVGGDGESPGGVANPAGEADDLELDDDASRYGP
jgi:hypothetical protein